MRFKRILHALFPFADFFYILQQEEYSGTRFLKWLPRFFLRRNIQVRDTLKYTKRVKSSLAFVVALWLASLFAASAAVAFAPFSVVLIAAGWLLAIPIFVLAGNWILAPYYGFLKMRVIRRAAATIARHGEMKIVAVAGSFGKTTTKQFIYQLAQYTYAAQVIPGNINTPLGIAMWVNAYLKPGTQLLIVEMDAYRRGEIARSASIVPPDLAIVTNVGDQHLERFGNREKLAAALGEVFAGAKPGAKLLCTAETAAALGYRAVGSGDAVSLGTAGLTIVSGGGLDILDAPTKQHFSASNLINLAFAVKAAQLLQVPRDFIVDTCAKMELPERRQKEDEWHGYSAIDDSYNISLTTARAGVEAAAALAKREGKKLLVVTAGIPELGPREKDGNEKLGELIASRADHAAILKSMFAGDVAKGVRRYDKAVTRNGKSFSMFPDLNAFFAQAPGRFPPGQWVVLVQPELTDLYY